MIPKYYWSFVYGLPIFVVDPYPLFDGSEYMRKLYGREIKVVKWMPTNWVFYSLAMIIEGILIVFEATFKKGE